MTESTKSSRKVIITCAVTGAIHTPSMSPHLPVTPKEIADAAVAAAEAGAAIVHLHARDPVDGRPTQDPKYFLEFAPEIARRSDVVINFTTGGAPTMLVEERLQPALQLKPEVASLNMGSMNFGLYPMLARFKDFKFDWERPYLEGSFDRVFKNTFRDIEHILTSCAGNATRFEIECYDIGHLYTAKHFFDRGTVKAPLFIQSVFGILGGIGPHPGRCRPHEAHGRSIVRRSISLERAGCRPQSVADCCDVGCDGRQRSGRARRQSVARAWQASRIERRAGAQGAPDHRRPGTRNRIAG